MYAAQNRALAMIETLVHLTAFPTDYLLITVSIPEDVSVMALAESDLPNGWDSAVAISATKDIGSAWANRNQSAVLSVPSIVVPGERNYLLNPAHADFARITVDSAEPIAFDSRLWKTGTSNG